jgi:hypothetical protein
MKFLLSVIALCLVMITAKLYIPEAHAEVGGMNWFAMQQDKDFSQAVRLIVEERCFSSGSFSKNKIYCPAS